MAKAKTIKVKAAILNPKRYAGATQVAHFGHMCDVTKEGFLVCDMDEELASIEIAAGRFMVIDEKKDEKKDQKPTE